jgi:hypothetical protein
VLFLGWASALRPPGRRQPAGIPVAKILQAGTRKAGIAPGRSSSRPACSSNQANFPAPRTSTHRHCSIPGWDCFEARQAPVPSACLQHPRCPVHVCNTPGPTYQSSSALLLRLDRSWRDRSGRPLRPRRYMPILGCPWLRLVNVLVSLILRRRISLMTRRFMDAR